MTNGNHFNIVRWYVRYGEGYDFEYLLKTADKNDVKGGGTFPGKIKEVLDCFIQRLSSETLIYPTINIISNPSQSIVDDISYVQGNPLKREELLDIKAKLLESFKDITFVLEN